MATLEACAPCLTRITGVSYYNPLVIDGEFVDYRLGTELDQVVTRVNEALADGREVKAGDNHVFSAHVTYEGVPMCLFHFAQAYDG